MGQSVKKLKTRKKGVLGADELNAYRNAYEKPLVKKDYLFYLGMPALFVGGLLFILTYTWYLGLVGVIIGAIYGRKILMPKAVIRSYEILSFNERNRMLNLITQQRSNASKIPKEVLVTVTNRLDGELKKDFQLIATKIANGATNKEIKLLFEFINEKYQFDIVFCQYMEQLETNFTTGIDNLDSLKDMTSYHNDLREKRDVFLRYKTARLKDCRLLIGIFLILIGAIEFGFGFDMFVQIFASQLIGKVVSIAYVLILCVIMRSFFKYYFDDSIMEARVR